MPSEEVLVSEGLQHQRKGLLGHVVKVAAIHVHVHDAAAQLDLPHHLEKKTRLEKDDDETLYTVFYNSRSSLFELDLGQAKVTRPKNGEFDITDINFDS